MGISVDGRALLGHIPLFNSLLDEEINELAGHMKVHKCNAGDVIFRQKEKGAALYIVKQGEVRISLLSSDGKETILAHHGSGQFFGELSLFDEKPRSATARAISFCELVVLHREDLLQVMQSQPDVAVRLLHTLSERLRETNNLLHAQVTRNLNDTMRERASIADRLADRVAEFGGSWIFIVTFITLTAVWITVNSIRLFFPPFDVYPFNFLNLLLAMITALQAPLILMSENRQATKDRIRSDLDYQINLKNETILEELTNRLDSLLTRQDEMAARLEQLHLHPRPEAITRGMSLDSLS